jgi:predicted RNase H-like nuclease (RuvC/YqgF family)
VGFEKGFGYEVKESKLSVLSDCMVIVKDLCSQVASFGSILKENNLVLEKFTGWFQDLVAEVSGLKSEVSGLKSEVSGLKSEVSGLKSEVSGLKSEVSGLKSEVSGLKSEVSGLKASVDLLIGEVSRLSSRGELMLTVFGFCHLHDISLNRQELAAVGRRASRYSRKFDYKVETVADNTFGRVNVYERKVLEVLLLGEED